METTHINWSKHHFHPVIRLPEAYEVFDFTQGYDPHRKLSGDYGIGKYDEKRRGMYETDLFTDGRDIHVGIDIAAPVATPVHSFFDGQVHLFGYNGAPGDYGYTLITRHELDGVCLYALYGHLNAASVTTKTEGQKIRRGEVIAWVGDTHENGGWNPHLHFQLSFEKPLVADLPGVVSEADRETALKKFPDPRLVLGPIY